MLVKALGLQKRKDYLVNLRLKKIIDEADAILIGVGSGLSSAASFEYGGKTFMDNFKYIYDDIRICKVQDSMILIH